MNHSSDVGGPSRAMGRGKKRERDRKGKGKGGKGERDGEGERESFLSHGSVDHNFILPQHLKQEA